MRNVCEVEDGRPEQQNIPLALVQKTFQVRSVLGCHEAERAVAVALSAVRNANRPDVHSENLTREFRDLWRDAPHLLWRELRCYALSGLLLRLELQLDADRVGVVWVDVVASTPFQLG